MTVGSLFENGVAAFSAGDMSKAETQFRACLALQPDHLPSMLNLGIMLLNRGVYAEAETHLNQAAARQPTLEAITALAILMEQTGRPAKAEYLYTKILETAPNEAATLTRLAVLRERYASRPAARRSFAKAWEANRKDIVAGLGYARMSLVDDSREAVRAVANLLESYRHDDAKHIHLLGDLLVYKEWDERMKRGLQPQHATGWADLFFPFSADELRQYRELAIKIADRNPSDTGAQKRKFGALFCCEDYLAAQETLRGIQTNTEEPLWNGMTFETSFYRRLEDMPDEELAAALPPLIAAAPADFTDRPSAYLSCDYFYFQAFAAPMVRSLAAVHPGGQVHVHLMDATDAEIQAAIQFQQEVPSLRMAISAEQPWIKNQGKAAARAYYHAIRFIRFYQHAREYRGPLWLMDVDALFNRDPSSMYGSLDDADIAMRIRPGRLEPWNQFNACVVGAAGTPAAKRYLKLIAAYISHYHRRNGLWWGIDQFAMYGAFTYLKDQGCAPLIAFLDDRALDYAYLDDGVIWCNSGKNKFAHLSKNADGSATPDDPDREKYVRLFRSYTNVISPALLA